MALYNATDGSNWTDSMNWDTDEALDHWHGVRTDDAGRVVRLDLHVNNLIGSIPPELDTLINLERLRLYENNLTGRIPPELGTLINLEELKLDNNNLTGPIPAELGALTNLENLHLHGNDLTGSIPPELGDLDQPQAPVGRPQQPVGVDPSRVGLLHQPHGIVGRGQQPDGTAALVDDQSWTTQSSVYREQRRSVRAGGCRVPGVVGEGEGFQGRNLCARGAHCPAAGTDAPGAAPAVRRRLLPRAAGAPLGAVGAEGHRAGMVTFAEAAERVWKDKNPGWRHPRHAQDWISSLRRYVLPDLGRMPVSEISSAEVLDTLRRIWHARPETARRVRQRISAVMDWAIAMQFRTDNPCDRLGPVLGPQQDLVQHMRALPHAEVAGAIRSMWGSGATDAVKLAFEFLVLTAARSGEVRGARSAEIDKSARVWTIPATRMKAKREHRVPLSGRAVEILKAARKLGDGRSREDGSRGRQGTGRHHGCRESRRPRHVFDGRRHLRAARGDCPWGLFPWRHRHAAVAKRKAGRGSSAAKKIGRDTTPT